jgi:ParB family chromosome partitioning protein
MEIPVEAIAPNPRQPRGAFSEEALAALARSIEEVGILQPIVVRRAAGGFELVAGERRVRAARMAGLSTVPGLLRHSDDAEVLREALIENIHREDLRPLELAAAFQELLEELGTSQDAVAERLGCSRAHVANTVRLLSLPPDVQRLLADGRIQAGHGRAILGLPDDQARSALALRAAAEGLSVREVEELVRRYTQVTVRRRLRPAHPTGTDPAVAEVEEILSAHLSTPVRVRLRRGGGTITVDFATREDLDRIVAEIAGAPATRAAG